MRVLIYGPLREVRGRKDSLGHDVMREGKGEGLISFFNI